MAFKLPHQEGFYSRAQTNHMHSLYPKVSCSLLVVSCVLVFVCQELVTLLCQPASQLSIFSKVSTRQVCVMLLNIISIAQPSHSNISHQITSHRNAAQHNTTQQTFYPNLSIHPFTSSAAMARNQLAREQSQPSLCVVIPTFYRQYQCNVVFQQYCSCSCNCTCRRRRQRLLEKSQAPLHSLKLIDVSFFFLQ